MTAPITKSHRLAIAQAWEGDGVLSTFIQRWVDGEPCKHPTVEGTLEALERVAQVLAEAEGGWVPVAEWPEEHSCVAIGYDLFYGRVGEVERAPGKQRWVFIDSQKDDCDVTHVRPLPQPPEAT